MIVKCRCGKLNNIEINKFAGELEETGKPCKIGSTFCEHCGKEIVIYASLYFPSD